VLWLSWLVSTGGVISVMVEVWAARVPWRPCAEQYVGGFCVARVCMLAVVVVYYVRCASERIFRCHLLVSTVEGSLQ